MLQFHPKYRTGIAIKSFVDIVRAACHPQRVTALVGCAASLGCDVLLAAYELGPWLQAALECLPQRNQVSGSLLASHTFQAKMLGLLQDVWNASSGYPWLYDQLQREMWGTVDSSWTVLCCDGIDTPDLTAITRLGHTPWMDHQIQVACGA